ncbi:hypothetical protein FNF29_07141 [Cafeteria roenbergensis]|uniref:GATOR2 complex protein MIO zinc-ribbon like domain-containing protein n=1 Tax=Cafeteria roenbergensis TaxID=33653 RepID=A0A5A8C569_CAFRO|nr:hypothetical protein FNF29_07141 [Cafeteria roenbergensis]|eukprot:KAA0147797.1 hypothetical protein FNF29_07141 [Cafeteria roenbergensis]
MHPSRGLRANPHIPGVCATVASSGVRLHVASASQSSRPPLGGQTFDVVSTACGDLDPKCMSWCPDPSNALMAAVGTRSGQIALTQLRDFDSPGAQQPIGLMGMSGLRRVTSDVAWCPASADLVASAMTGGQAAAAVNVWRIERVAADSSAAHTDLGAGISVGSFATPADRQLGSVGSTPLVASFLKADSASALDWQPGSASCLAVALMSRTVVLVDSRLSHSRFPDFTVHLPSRNIVTVQYEPGDASSLLTSTDCGDVRVWDLRMLDKPRSVIESSRRTTHTGLGFARWCPGQQGLVSTLAADGLTVELWDERRQQIVAAERRAAAAEDASGGGAAAAGAPRGSDRPAAGRDPVHLRGSASAARRLLQSELSGMDMAGAIGPGWSRGAGASRVLVAGRDGVVTDLGMRLVGAVDIFVGSGGAVAARVADTALTVAPTPLRSVAAPIGITARMRRRVAAGVGLNPARTCFALSRAVAALGWQHSVDRVLALASADAASAAGLSHPAHSQGALVSPGGWPGVEAGMPRQELRRQSKDLRCLRATWEWVAGPEASATAAKAALRAAGRRLRGAAPGTPLGALPPVPTGLPRLGMISLLAGRSPDASPARDASDDAPTAEGGPFRVGPFVAFGGAARAAALASCGWVTADEWSSCRLRPEDEASAVDPAEVWLDAAGKPVPKLGVAGSVPGVVLRCLAEGAYERAAALAVWHGDLRLATAVLRTAAERAEAQLKALQAALLAARAPAEGGAGAGVSAALLQAAADDRGVFKRAVYLAQEHRELMQLTAMAVAGFPGAGAAAEEAIRSGTCLPAAAVDGGSHLWADTCDGLRRRMRSKHPYLRCICAFLAACARPDAASTAQTLSDLQESAFGPAAGQNAAPGAAAAPAARPPVEAEWSTSPFLSILVERGLRRQDRAAFAARFLPDSQLLPFTRALARGAIMDGNILGLVLTGFTNAGVRVIQAYVDRTGDVHSAALLACFFDPSKVSARSARRALRWLQSFRDLLNRWKLWRERATLDVQRAKMVRSMEASKAAAKPSWRDRAAAAQPRPDGGTGPSAPAGSAAGAAAAAPAPAAASEQEQARDLALLGDLEPAGSLPPQVYSTATKASRWQDPSRAMRVTRRALPGGKGRSSALLTSGRAAGPSVRGHAAEAASAPSSLTVAQRLLGAVVTQHPAVFAFCNFCGDALALPWMVRSGKVNGEWVMKQRQRLIFCPMCHNPLPRCSLCLISMVSINPYKQWKLQSPATAQGRAASKPSSGREVADAPAVAPHLAVDEGDRPVPEDSANFSDWWTWCQSCRHGGHASHLAAWFKGHDVCPISGCGCRCRVLDERALASSDGEEDANALLFELD